MGESQNIPTNEKSVQIAEASYTRNESTVLEDMTHIPLIMSQFTTTGRIYKHLGRDLGKKPRFSRLHLP